MLILLLTFVLMGMNVSWIYAVWILPWIFIAPLMGKLIERKTTRAVDRLVRGIAQSK